MELEPIFKPVSGKIYSTKNCCHDGTVKEYPNYFLHRNGKFIQVQVSERNRFGQSGKYLVNGELGKDFFLSVDEARKDATEKCASFIRRFNKTIKVYQNKQKVFESGNEKDFIEKV